MIHDATEMSRNDRVGIDKMIRGCSDSGDIIVVSTDRDFVSVESIRQSITFLRPNNPSIMVTDDISKLKRRKVVDDVEDDDDSDDVEDDVEDDDDSDEDEDDNGDEDDE